MPLDHGRAQRLLGLSSVPPERLTPLQRGELRALIRHASEAQRWAILKALALSRPDPDQEDIDAYTRGALRAQQYPGTATTYEEGPR